MGNDFANYGELYSDYSVEHCDQRLGKMLEGDLGMQLIESCGKHVVVIEENATFNLTYY